MWAHVLSALIGMWMMSAPAVLGYGGAAQTNDHIVGPLAVTFAISSWWQVTRSLRWVNVVLGAWLLLAPWVLGYGTSTPGFNSMLAGAVLAGLSLVKGKTDKPLGGGWKAFWQG